MKDRANWDGKYIVPRYIHIHGQGTQIVSKVKSELLAESWY